MNKEEKIGIRREEQFIAAGHSLFEWLLKLGQATIVVISDTEKGLSQIKKHPKDIITLDFDYQIIGKKFYRWRFSNDEWWELSQEEYLQFIQCCHAAHFYMEKQDYNVGEMRDNINWLYESIMKKSDLSKLGSYNKKE